MKAIKVNEHLQNWEEGSCSCYLIARRRCSTYFKKVNFYIEHWVMPRGLQEDPNSSPSANGKTPFDMKI